MRKNTVCKISRHALASGSSEKSGPKSEPGTSALRLMNNLGDWSHQTIAQWMLATGLILLQGCGQAKEPTYPVKGQIVFKDNGEPAGVGGTIWIERMQDPFDRSGGPIDDIGEFTLGTNSPTDGAFAGKFRVRIDAQTMGGVPVATVSQTVDPKYFSFASSGIVQTIEPRPENTIKIEVERRTKPAASAKEKRPLGDDGTKVPEESEL